MNYLQIALLLQTAERPEAVHGTGLEWMVVASILVPAVVLGLIIYLGSKNTVG